MSLDEFIKEIIDGLIFEAINAIRDENRKILNEFSICNCSNRNTDKDKGLIETRDKHHLENQKLKNKSLNEIILTSKSTQPILQF